MKQKELRMSKDKYQNKRMYSIRGAVTKRKLKRMAGGQAIKAQLRKKQG